MKHKRGQMQPRGYRRTTLAAHVEQQIFDEIDKLARTFKHTRGWVVSTILADYLHIKLDPEYYKYDPDEPTAPAKRRRP